MASSNCSPPHRWYNPGLDSLQLPRGKINGAGRETRTPGPLITNQVLYQLSYAGTLCKQRALR